MVEQRKIVCHVRDKGEGDGEWGGGSNEENGGVCVACEDSSSILQKAYGPMHEMSVTEKVEANLFDKM